ncbi:MAG: Asp-tRNA(Asn)/Glu-tRNA(Gln) amidotransferase GatCAB subunit A, partial [Deltaproteobacteria bacterium]
DPLQMYLADVFTATVNLAGLPAISVPCGFSSAGLPIGMQLIAPAFHESSLLEIAHDFEEVTDFSQRKPPL